MAYNSSKLSLEDIYVQVCDILNKTVQVPLITEHQVLPARQFIMALNNIMSMIVSETDTIERMALLSPDRRWLRYIKITQEEANNGMVRIDLEGQKPVLQSANDPDNLDWQYENVCTGDGVDPNYIGTEVKVVGGTSVAPDSFPKIYLPAECDIPEGVFDNAAMIGRGSPDPAGNQDRIGGTNEPLTPFVIDMRRGGYGSNDPTNVNYPTTSQYERFFIDPDLIYALRRITYTTGTNGAIPQSSDAYLNDTWATILGMVGGAGVAGTCAVATFTRDGVVYTVTIPQVNYNATTGAPFDLTITSASGETFTYRIRPTDRPWQTVATYLNANRGTNRWGNWMLNQALYSNRAWYVKLNDFVIRLPDDLRRIKWMWKVPTSTLKFDIPVDPTADIIAQAIEDSEPLMYNKYDQAFHYFPITETRFTQLKYLETQGYNFDGAGWYLQIGQQLRLVPRPKDLASMLIAVIYEAKPDNIDPATTITNFYLTFMELPSEAVNVIIYLLAASRYRSSRIGDLDKAHEYEMLGREWLEKLKKLYSGRQGQQADAPTLQMDVTGSRETDYVGFNTLFD